MDAEKTLSEKIIELAVHNGIQDVEELLVNECYELIEAINNGTKILTEVVDVYNLSLQWLHLINDDDAFVEELKYKVARARKRVGLDEEERPES